MQLHRMLTFLGVVLLVATLAIFYNEDVTNDEFSLAYVTGIAMIAVFMASFVMFNKQMWSKRK